MQKNNINFYLEPNLIKEIILGFPLEEQDYYIALWIAQKNVLEDMRYRSLPTKPLKFKDLKDEELKSYYERKGQIKAQNWRNLKELKWAKEILKDNEELVIRIEAQINGFIDIEEHPEPINMDAKDKHWQD